MCHQLSKLSSHSLPWVTLSWIKHGCESQLYSLPWTNLLASQNFCLLICKILLGMILLLRVFMRVKWSVKLQHIKYLVKPDIFHRLITHMQETLLNMDFSISAIFYSFHQSVQLFSLQICILNKLIDCTVDCNILLNSLECQAVPKASRMYFFKHMTTGDNDVVPRIRPRKLKKEKRITPFMLQKVMKDRGEWWHKADGSGTRLLTMPEELTSRLDKRDTLGQPGSYLNTLFLICLLGGEAQRKPLTIWCLGSN